MEPPQPRPRGDGRTTASTPAGRRAEHLLPRNRHLSVLRTALPRFPPPPSFASSSTVLMAPPGEARPLPRDARTIALIASSMGIQEVETSALVQLLDFCHRYTYDVLQDAMVYADHANSGSASRGAPTSVSLEDVQLAVQSRVNYSFTPPPSKEVGFLCGRIFRPPPGLPCVSGHHASVRVVGTFL